MLELSVYSDTPEYGVRPLYKEHLEGARIVYTVRPLNKE